MSDERNSDVTPESLMSNFKGPKFVSLVILTVVVHVALIFGSSLPYLKNKMFGDKGGLSKDEKIKLAVEEATIEIRKIAEDYDLGPQDITDQFSGKSRAPKPVEKPDEGEKPEEEPGDGSVEDPEKPKSAIELKIEEKKEGPKAPVFNDKDDIF